MAIASGIAKSLRVKKETTWGTAPGTGSAQVLRRKTSDLNVVKGVLESEELRSDYQVADVRHAVRSVQGTITNELSCKTYQDFLSASLRADTATLVAAPTTGAIATVTAAATPPHFSRSGGSFLSDGFKIGMLCRWTGWTTTGVNNNSRNFLITTLAATTMSGVFLDGTAVAAKASGDSVTCLGFKAIKVPDAGSTFYDQSFSIEHWFSDVAQSELYLGCKIARVGLKIPGNEKSSVEFGIIGKDATNATSAYYTSPTAETTTGILTCLNGSLYYAGTKIATVTNCDINIEGGYTPAEPVLGSVALQAVFPGRVRVSGQLTAYFEDAVLRDAFLNETTGQLVMALAAGSTATAEAMSIVLPKIKVNGTSKDDGEKGLIQTVPFIGLLDPSGGTGTATHKSAVYFVDTEAV